MKHQFAREHGQPIETAHRGARVLATLTVTAMVSAALAFVTGPSATLRASAASIKTTKGHRVAPEPDGSTGVVGHAQAGRVGPRFASTGGSSWGWQNPTIQGNALNSISCAAAGYCTAVGDAGTIIATGNSGVNWLSQVPAAGAQLLGVSCTSATSCVAVGAGGSAATSSGTTWTARSSGVTSNINAIICPSTTCYAAGDGGKVLLSTNSGVSWSTVTVPVGGSVNLEGMSCASTSWCVAVGTLGTIVTFNGTTWSAGTSGTTETLRSVSCPSSSSCTASGNHGTVVTYNGSAWTHQASLTLNNLAAVSCVSGTSCASVGDSGSAYGGGGSSWTAQTTGTSNALRAVACTSHAAGGATNLQCWGVGAAGTIVYTGNQTYVYYGAANSWALQGHSATSQDLTSVSCPSTTACVAVGWNGAAVSTVTGSYWTSISTGTTNPFTGLACPSTTLCWAVGLDVGSNHPYLIKLTYASYAWSATVTSVTWTAPQGFFNGVSCASSTSCVAVGDGGIWAAYNGSSWTGSVPSPVGPNLNGVTCLSSTNCVAVGDSGTVKSYNGTAWTAATTTGTANFLTGVACAGGSGPCAAVGALGTVIQASSPTSATWAVPSSVASARDLLGVSCPSSTSCMAVGEGGTALSAGTYSGAWSAVTTGTGNALGATTCTTTSCVSVGNPGSIVTSAPTGVTEDIAALNTSNQVEISSTTGASATNTSWLTNTGGTLYGAPAMVWVPNLGIDEIFGLDSSGNGVVWETSWTPGQPFNTAWNWVWGGAVMYAGARTVSADLRPDGYIDLTMRGTGTSDPGWSTIVQQSTRYTGYISTGGVPQGTVTGYWSGGELDVLCVGGTGGSSPIYVQQVTSSSPAWHYVGVYTLAAYVNTNVRLDGGSSADLFREHDTNDHPYRDTLSSGGSGNASGADQLGGTTSYGDVNGPPSAVWNPTSIDAYVIGTTNVIWKITETGSTWGSWSGLSNSLSTHGVSVSVSSR
jgi:hypothetical protein